MCAHVCACILRAQVPLLTSRDSSSPCPLQFAVYKMKTPPHSRSVQCKRRTNFLRFQVLVPGRVDARVTLVSPAGFCLVWQRGSRAGKAACGGFAVSGLTTRGRLASGERPLRHCPSGVTVRGSLTLAGQAVAGSPSMWREAWPEAPPVAGSGGSGWNPLREAGAWPEAPPRVGGVPGSPSVWRGRDRKPIRVGGRGRKPLR